MDTNQSFETDNSADGGYSTDKAHEIITPNSPHWNSAIALGVWIFSIVSLVLLVNAAVIAYALLNEMTMAQIGEAVQNQTNSNILLIGILTTLPAHILTLTAVWLVVTRAGKYPFLQTLGWNWGSNLGFWGSVGIALGFFLLAGSIIALFGETENDLTRILRSSRAAVYATAFLATVTAPFVEETVYRGVMYSAFRRNFGNIGAIALVTILFAVVHVPQYYPSYGVILAILLLSLVLTYVRAATGNLLPCVVIHTVFNGIQSILLIAEPFIFPKTSAPVVDPSFLISPLLFK